MNLSLKSAWISIYLTKNAAQINGTLLSLWFRAKTRMAIERTHRFRLTSNYTNTLAGTLFPYTCKSCRWQFDFWVRVCKVILAKGHSSQIRAHKCRWRNRLLWSFIMLLLDVIVWLTIKTTVSIALVGCINSMCR